MAKQYYNSCHKENYIRYRVVGITPAFLKDKLYRDNVPQLGLVVDMIY